VLTWKSEANFLAEAEHADTLPEQAAERSRPYMLVYPAKEMGVQESIGIQI